MKIETERLILRPWTEADAEDLYTYACDPDVGPAAGWPVHTSVENSREIIRNVLSAEETYAVCLKDGRAIGSVGLKEPAEECNARNGEKEIGYWIGKPYWGNGYIAEAVKALEKRAFNELACTALWCGYYEGNVKSRRAQEKCGFAPHHRSKEAVEIKLLGEKRFVCVSRLSREDWQKAQMVFTTAQKDDLSAVAELYHSVMGTEFCTWNEYYPSREEIENDYANGSLYVLKDGETVVGALSVVPQNELDDLPCWTEREKPAEIARIAVLPKWQGKHMASLMIGRIEEILQEKGYTSVHLLAAKKNVPACRTYFRLGYGVRGEETMYGNEYFACEKRLNMIYTPRLVMREMTENDYEALYAVLADSDIMKHYPYIFDEKRVRSWIAKNEWRNRVFGFGLWAVCLRQTGEMVGDCGLTMQNINGLIRPEIGYHIRRDRQRFGIATEAATAWREWAFAHTTFGEVFSYMHADNVASRATAEATGMRLAEEYTDPEEGPVTVYSIRKC